MQKHRIFRRQKVKYGMKKFAPALSCLHAASCRQFAETDSEEAGVQTPEAERSMAAPYYLPRCQGSSGAVFM